ncbi:hypothetical protein imdm_1532 [gamma proteobacterium IMCC2047]|nr:hypothetical protein imdm_1532 [gamma proteobacterium IMCC2047]
MTRFRPGSSKPSSSRNSAFSSSSSSMISASSLLQIETTIAFSRAAISFTVSRCGLFSKPSSSTLAMYMVGLVVSRWKLRTSFCSSSSKSSARTGRASLRCGSSFSSSAFSLMASLSPPLAVRVTRCNCFSTLSKSARANSVLMTSISAAGSILLATWMTLSSSKQRTTWAIASVSRMLARNWLPKPSPLEAPATKPAISTNSMVVGTTRSGLTMAASLSWRGSGTGTMPEFGSMVQKGKFSAPMRASVSALNSVDLPTLGRPTMPHLKPMV